MWLNPEICPKILPDQDLARFARKGQMPDLPKLGLKSSESLMLIRSSTLLHAA